MFDNVQIQKIGGYVIDYERSLAFYRDTLQLPIAWENEAERHAGFAIGQNILVIRQNADQSMLGGWRVYFTVDDLEAFREVLIQRGVSCTSVHEYDGFRTVDFMDPDGNRLGLFEPTVDYASALVGYLQDHLDA